MDMSTRGWRIDPEWDGRDFLTFMLALVERGGENIDKVRAWLAEYDRFDWMPPLWDANPFPRMRLWP